MLTVLNDAGRHKSRAKLWQCLCSCGSTTTVKSTSLLRGKTKSCGCLQAIKPNGLRHGHAVDFKPTKTYNSWACAKQRCTNPNNNRYIYYGAQGVHMCERWMNSFDDFLADMGPRPPGCSIERIDRSRGYEPGNCIWADARSQSRNRRNAIHVVLDGQTMTLPVAAERLGISYGAAKHRVDRGKLQRVL